MIAKIHGDYLGIKNWEFTSLHAIIPTLQDFSVTAHIFELSTCDNVYIFADKSRADELEKIIEEENLKPEETRNFVANAFRDGQIKATGMAFAGILPPVSMFDADNARAKKKGAVLDKLRAFFDKYFGV